MKTLTQLLAETPLFAGAAGSVLAPIAGCGRNVALAADQYVFREGAPADEFYLIRRGRVALEQHDPRRKTLVVETLGPGDLLGAAWLVPPHRFEFDARAVEPTGCVAFDARCIRERCDADPILGYALMRRFVPLLVERLQAARRQALDLYGRTP